MRSKLSANSQSKDKFSELQVFFSVNFVPGLSTKVLLI